MLITISAVAVYFTLRKTKTGQIKQLLPVLPSDKDTVSASVLRVLVVVAVVVRAAQQVTLDNCSLYPSTVQSFSVFVIYSPWTLLL